MTPDKKALLDKECTASIFIPELNDYVEIVGGKCEQIDGKQYLRIICEDSKGNEVCLNLKDLGKLQAIYCSVLNSNLRCLPPQASLLMRSLLFIL